MIYDNNFDEQDIHSENGEDSYFKTKDDDKNCTQPIVKKP